MYINIETNTIQSTSAPGLYLFPDEFMSEFFMPGKRAAGFVIMTHDDTSITSCVWDDEAYQAWDKANPEQPPEVPPPTPDERINTLEDAMCEQDMATQQRLADIEDALCQLDTNGGM